MMPLAVSAQTLLDKVVTDLSADKFMGRKVGTSENQEAAEYLAKEFKNLNLTPCVGDSYLIPFDYNGQQVYNVCGLKKGKTDKIIALGAHFDHVGSDDQGDDKIFNGADDNASGVAMTVALAEKLTKKSSDDSFMFIGFNAEEVGLVGAKELAENKDFEKYLNKIKAMFVFEMLGTISSFGENKVYMTGDDRSDFIGLLNKNLKNNFVIEQDPYKKYQLFYRSDNAPFVNKGIVAHAFSTVDMQTAKHYHQKNDEIDIINLKNMNQLADSFYQTIEAFSKSKAEPKLN